MQIDDRVRGQVWRQVWHQVEDVLDRNVGDLALVQIPDNKVWIIIGYMIQDQILDQIQEGCYDD
jgi:hypothetical protein